jgi:hypothetical protein
MPAAPPVVETVPQYTIDLTLSYLNHQASVQQEIVYQNRSGVTFNELIVMVEANRYPNAFQLNELQVDGVAVTNYTLEKNRLLLPLSVPLQPTESLTLRFNFDLFLPVIPPPADDRRPELFGYTERQTNLVDWYPQVAVYQPEVGWLDHPAWVFGEHQVYEPGDYQITFRQTDPVENFTVAASAEGVTEGNATTYRLSSARNFAFSFSHMAVTAKQEWQGITVTSYTFPFDAAAGQEIVRYAVEALQTYTRFYGPLPFKTLAIVEADFLDGMEFDGLFFLSKGFYNIYDGSPASYLGAITVHETAHQWWYAQVGNDQALEPWLDEALCTFSELLYFEQNHPEGVAWWEQVRVGYYSPEGVINLPVSAYPSYIAYRNAVYLRGGLFLRDLRQTTGEEPFYRALQAIQSQHADRGIITAGDFFAAFSQSAQADLKPLLAEYFAQESR